jgi:hypothetical protein
MKRHLLLVPMILVTSAAIADSQTSAHSAPADAQTQAAALLRPAHAIGTVKADTRPLSPSPASAPLDTHQSAAALLSGARSKNRVNAVSAAAQSTDAEASTDAHAQAAALLSGSRVATSQANRTDGGARAIGTAH